MFFFCFCIGFYKIFLKNIFLEFMILEELILLIFIYFKNGRIYWVVNRGVGEERVGELRV